MFDAQNEKQFAEFLDTLADYTNRELAEFAKRAAESGNFLNFAAWYALGLVAVDLRNELNF